MPFAVRIGFVILAHLFVLVKYFFKLFFEVLSNFLSRTRLCCFVSFAATLIFYQSLSGLSSTFFIFLIPSPDLFSWFLNYLFLRFFDELLYFIVFVIFCQVLFSRSLSNGERGIWTLAPLLTTYSLSRGAPSASLGTSPQGLNLYFYFFDMIYSIILYRKKIRYILFHL